MLQIRAHAHQHQIQYRQRRHGFYHDHSSRHYDGIMPAFDLNIYVLSGFVHGLLLLKNRRRGFKIRF